MVDKVTRLPTKTAKERAVERVQGVRRRDGTYRINGRAYLSVTSVLQTLAKPALTTWAARTAAAKVLEDPERYSTAEAAASAIYGDRDQAADRGSTVHSFIEAINRGAKLDLQNLPESLYGYGQAFQGFMDVCRPQVIQTEANVFSDRYGYAGTCDLIAEMQDGAVWLIDFKTGKGVYEEAKLQLCAYRHSSGILPRLPNVECAACSGSGATDGVRCEACVGGGMLVEPEPLPHIEKTGVVLLQPDGTWSLTETDAPIEVFVALMKVHIWVKGL